MHIELVSCFYKVHHTSSSNDSNNGTFPHADTWVFKQSKIAGWRGRHQPRLSDDSSEGLFNNNLPRATTAENTARPLQSEHIYTHKVFSLNVDGYFSEKSM